MILSQLTGCSDVLRLNSNYIHKKRCPVWLIKTKSNPQGSNSWWALSCHQVEHTGRSQFSLRLHQQHVAISDIETISLIATCCSDNFGRLNNNQLYLKCQLIQNPPSPCCSFSQNKIMLKLSLDWLWIYPNIQQTIKTLGSRCDRHVLPTLSYSHCIRII